MTVDELWAQLMEAYGPYLIAAALIWLTFAVLGAVRDAEHKRRMAEIDRQIIETLDDATAQVRQIRQDLEDRR